MKTTLEHFSDSVPTNVRSAMAQFAESAAYWIDDLSGDNFGDAAAIEPVEYKSRDGFISYNDGGYSVTQRFFCGYGSGIYHTKKEREFYEHQQSRCFEEFCREYNKQPDDSDIYELEEFWQYEADWFSEFYTIIEFEIFVENDTGEIQVSLLAHYRDAPYHRPKYAEEIFGKKYNPDEIGDTPKILDAIKNAYKEA